MFCPKCGTKVIDGAAFCQKCGAKLIQNNREEKKPVPVPIQESVEIQISPTRIPLGSEQKAVKEKEPTLEGEQIQVLSSESAEHPVSSMEPIMETAQDVNIQEALSSLPGSNADIYELLKEKIGMCSAIKSAKPVKKGVWLRGKIYNHFVRLVTAHTVNARIQSVLAFPFAILYGLLAILFCTTTGVILQELMKYGSICIEYYHYILFALCCLVTGAVVLIHSFVGRKEKAAVETYVHEVLEQKQIYLSDKRSIVAFKVRIAVAVVMVVIGLIVLPSNLPSPVNYPDELLFGGLPVDRFLEMTKEDVEAEFGVGEPSNRRSDFDDYYYDLWTEHVVYSKTTGKVIYIQLLGGSNCSYNQKRLNKSMDRVLDILDDEYYVPTRLSYGLYGSIHCPFYYYDGVYFGDIDDISATEYLAQQEVENKQLEIKGSVCRFVPIRAWKKADDYGMKEIEDSYRIDLIFCRNNYQDDWWLYAVCLCTDEWFETVNPTENASEGFVGNWIDATLTYDMDIEYEDGIYIINITQDIGGDAWNHWSLEGTLNRDGDSIQYSGNYAELYMREDGTVGGGGVGYEADGSIYFGEEGILYWEDSAENMDIIRFVADPGSDYEAGFSMAEPDLIESDYGLSDYGLSDYELSDYELSDFSYENLYLYCGSYEGMNQTSISVSIYSSFDEGNTVGNIRLYDSLGYESFAIIRDDNEGDGIYTLCFDDSKIMYIQFYGDFYGEYYADILGLDNIYTNVNEIETYIMTEQYIP